MSSKTNLRHNEQQEEKNRHAPLRDGGHAIIVTPDFAARFAFAPLTMGAGTLLAEHVIGAIVGIAVAAGPADGSGMRAAGQRAYVGRTRVAVIADGIVEANVTGVGFFIAELDRTHGLIARADYRSTGNASLSRAFLYAVAEESVAATTVIRDRIAGVSALITEIIGACDAVIANRRSSWNASLNRIACFGSVAEKSVVAQLRIRRVDTLIRVFVASVQRTCHSVAAVDRRACHTAMQRIAQFDAIAEQTIVAEAGYRNMVAALRGLVAHVLRA